MEKWRVAKGGEQGKLVVLIENSVCKFGGELQWKEDSERMGERTADWSKKKARFFCFD